jgi:hypothetical protein
MVALGYTGLHNLAWISPKETERNDSVHSLIGKSQVEKVPSARQPTRLRKKEALGLV